MFEKLVKLKKEIIKILFYKNDDIKLFIDKYKITKQNYKNKINYIILMKIFKILKSKYKKKKLKKITINLLKITKMININPKSSLQQFFLSIKIYFIQFTLKKLLFSDNQYLMDYITQFNLSRDDFMSKLNITRLRHLMKFIKNKKNYKIMETIINEIKKIIKILDLYDEQNNVTLKEIKYQIKKLNNKETIELSNENNDCDEDCDDEDLDDEDLDDEDLDDEHLDDEDLDDDDDYDDDDDDDMFDNSTDLFDEINELNNDENDKVIYHFNNDLYVNKYANINSCKLKDDYQTTCFLNNFNENNKEKFIIKMPIIDIVHKLVGVIINLGNKPYSNDIINVFGEKYIKNITYNELEIIKDIIIGYYHKNGDNMDDAIKKAKLIDDISSLWKEILHVLMLDKTATIEIIVTKIKQLEQKNRNILTKQRKYRVLVNNKGEIIKELDFVGFV